MLSALQQDLQFTDLPPFFTVIGTGDSALSDTCAGLGSVHSFIFHHLCLQSLNLLFLGQHLLVCFDIPFDLGLQETELLL